MWDFDYCSVNSICSLLEENGLGMSKKFGQNFLISSSSLEKIAGFASISKDMKVWEIGPGIGALTKELVKTGANVTAFEIDHGFCRILKEKAFTNTENLTIVEGDALKIWKQIYEEQGCPDVICANLPYNVGSVIIASFIENRMLPKKMVFTLQSEVVQRICALPGDETYSSFSILSSVDYENREVLKLKSSCFWPAPNVGSSVVVMTKRDTSLVPKEYEQKFFSTTRALFSQRRKTVKNNLKTIVPSFRLDEVLSNAGLCGTERAENLSISQILEISKFI